MYPYSEAAVAAGQAALDLGKSQSWYVASYDDMQKLESKKRGVLVDGRVVSKV